MTEYVKVSGIANWWSEDQVTGQLAYSLSRTKHEVVGEVADLKSFFDTLQIASVDGDARVTHTSVPTLCHPT